MTILSQKFIYSAMDAENNGEQFPIDLSDIYKSAGYSRERDALRRLSTSRLVNGIDYVKSRFSDALRETIGGRPSNKVKLSVDGYKSFLLAANTDEGEEARKYFIEVEKQYRKQLESLFNSQLDDRHLIVDALNDAENEVLKLQQELENLKQQLAQSHFDHQNYSFGAKFLHQVSGIANYSQVKNAVKRDFVEGRDYIVVDKELYLNESTFNILIASFRSVRGTDISRLPEIIKLETKLYFQYQELRRKNKRVSQCIDHPTLEFTYQAP